MPAIPLSRQAWVWTVAGVGFIAHHARGNSEGTDPVCRTNWTTFCTADCPDKNADARPWAKLEGNKLRPCCPEGMDKVAPPVPSPNYRVVAYRHGTTEAKSYVTCEKLKIVVEVLSESFKFLGMVLYAFRPGDASEEKIGTWTVPDHYSELFRVPSECSGSAVTHKSAVVKHYRNPFYWTAPGNGTGPIKFRLLIKHGETNGGAFFLPSRDLELSESITSLEHQWVQSAVGQSCADACAAAGGTCDEQKLREHTSMAWPQQFSQGPEQWVTCGEPFMKAQSSDTCNARQQLTVDADGQCWYRTDGACTPSCAGTVANHARICACSLPAGGISGCSSYAAMPGSGDGGSRTALLNGARHSAHASVTALAMLVAAARTQSPVALLTAAVAAAFPQAAHAHNWMNNPPSRTQGLTKESPCPSRQGSAVHIVVTSADDFWLEYATGHFRYTYITIVKAEDEDKLREVNENTLRTYHDGDSTEYLSGVQYKKHHVRSHGCTSRNCKGVSNQQATAPGQYLTREVTPNEFHFSRPGNWRCARAPPAFQRCNGIQHSYYEYDEQSVRQDTTRAYTNAQYPFIIASGKYKMLWNRAKDHDLVAFRMPQGLEPGQYVVQYFWNGYRDCMDLTLVGDGGSTELVTAMTWLKYDHCQFMQYNGTPLSSCTVLPANGDATACKQLCNEVDACTGLNVVPYRNPSDVLHSSYSNIPFDTAGCSRSELEQAVGSTPGVTIDNAKVCYGFQPLPPPEVGTSHLVTADPYDALFYSTCFSFENVTTLSGSSAGAAAVYPWAWRDKCMDCTHAKTNFELSADFVANWSWITECRWCPSR